MKTVLERHALFELVAFCSFLRAILGFDIFKPTFVGDFLLGNNRSRSRLFLDHFGK